MGASRKLSGNVLKERRRSGPSRWRGQPPFLIRGSGAAEAKSPNPLMGNRSNPLTAPRRWRVAPRLPRRRRSLDLPKRPDTRSVRSSGDIEGIAAMTAATSLLDFILNLLKNPQAQAEFRASPEHVLAANGLTGVSAADISGTLPLVTDRRARMTGGRTMRGAASVMRINCPTGPRPPENDPLARRSGNAA